MSNSRLAAPELAAIEVHGMTRSAFILRSALTAGAVYGGSVVGPFVGRAFAQEAGGDVEILNFALTLEQLEAKFYEEGEKTPGLSAGVKDLASRISENEAEHVDTLTQTIQKVGGKPGQAPTLDFGNAFRNEKSFLKLAQTLEDTGVSAYNGAGPQIESKEILAAAGSIVQVEARHAAAIRLRNNANPAPKAFDDTLSKDAVLDAVKPFIQS